MSNVGITVRLVAVLALPALMAPLGWAVQAARLDVSPPDAPVTLEWSHPLPDDPNRSAVALVPGHGSVSATSFQQRQGRISELVVRRWTAGGSRLWMRRWDGGRAVRAVSAGQVAVNPASGSIIVAGNATCRFGASESGPMFMRQYDASGRVLWTRWDDRRCPTRDDPSPTSSPSDVTGLDISARAIVVSFNYGDFCCEDRTRDGVVRAYSHSGRLIWVRDIEFPQFTHTNDVVEDVALEHHRVVAVGRVETKRPGAPHLDVESWVVSMGLASGRTNWRRVAGDTGPGDYDANTSVDAGRGTLVLGGVRNATLASDDPGTAVVERLRRTGDLLWRRRLPSASRVESTVALPDGDVVVAAQVGQEYGVDLLLRRLRSDGTQRWDYLWDRGDRSVFIEDFDAEEHRGVGGGYTGTEPGVDPVARLWSWRW